MLKYFTSDLYALKKMKIVYILPIVLIVMVLMSNFITTRLNFAAIGMKEFENQMAQMENEDLDEQLKDSFSVGFNAGFEASTQAYEPEPIKLNELFDGGMAYDSTVADLFVSSISGLTYLMLAAIFAAFFYGSQMKGAYIKNILKANDNRWLAYTSKVLTVFLYAVMFMILTFLVNVFCGAVMCKSFEMGIDGNFFKYVGLQLLLTFGMCAITGLVAMLTNTGLGMVFAIVAGSGLLNLAYMLIDILVNYAILGDGDFSLSDYLITGNVAAMTLESSGSDIVRAVIVAIAFIAVGFGVGGFYNSKRDIH